MFNHPFSVWLFALVFFVLGLSLYCLVRWNKNLKKALNVQLELHNSKNINTTQLELVTEKPMNFNMAAFVVITIIILSAVIFFYEYYESDESIITRVTSTILLAVALFGGFSLGNLRRKYEANHFLNQLVKQTSQREWVERKSSLSEDRLKKQQIALSTLTQNQLHDWHDPSEVFRELVMISAQTLNVERVGVWLLDESRTQLNCSDLYIKSQHHYIEAEPLVKQALPQYSNALDHHRVLVVNNVFEHDATAELIHDYMPTHNIGATLEGGIWLNNQLIGVICHEHVGGPREWTLDEQNFVGSITALIILTIETHRRRKAEMALAKQNLNLEQQIQIRTQALQESEKTFRYVMEHSPLIIFTINQDGKLEEFNPEAESQLGYNFTEAVGKNPIELFVAKESRNKAIKALDSVMSGSEPRKVELFLIRGDGQKIEFEFSGSLGAADAKTGLRKMVVIGQEITQKKALQRTLIEARQAAQSADRTKSMFVAAMSHELRTPLNSIIGFLGVVLQGISGELNPAQKSQLGRAYESSKHLLLLVSDVLDVSKIEAGFLQLDTEIFELKPMFTEAEHAVQHLLVGKKLALRVDCAAKLWMETDRKRLYQVVLNVLSNAIKYTENGTVKLTAHIENNNLTITCQDTGIGINKGDFSRLFQPFVRVDSPLKIKTPGTGLGLYLIHRILTQLLGGSITVQSEVGQGSTFTIIMPTYTLGVDARKATSSVISETKDTIL